MKKALVFIVCLLIFGSFLLLPSSQRAIIRQAEKDGVKIEISAFPSVNKFSIPIDRVAGHYDEDADMIWLNSKKVESWTYYHELGHRIWSRILSEADKQQWKNWFEEKKYGFSDQSLNWNERELFAEHFAYMKMGYKCSAYDHGTKYYREEFPIQHKWFRGFEKKEKK